MGAVARISNGTPSGETELPVELSFAARGDSRLLPPAAESPYPRPFVTHARQPHGNEARPAVAKSVLEQTAHLARPKVSCRVRVTQPNDPSWPPRRGAMLEVDQRRAQAIQSRAFDAGRVEGRIRRRVRSCRMARHGNYRRRW